MNLYNFLEAVGIQHSAIRNQVEREQGFTVVIEHEGREIPADITDIRFEYNNGKMVIETKTLALAKGQETGR